jgi:MFS transporter, OFA family, oxalate/formate antiporter
VPQMKKTPKIFYGWWIVAACFVICVSSGGVVVYGFTAFFNPIIQEFGWSYAAVSFAASLRGVETGLLAPVLGFFVDRWGSKWILFAGSILTGVGLILLGQVNSLAQFYGTFVIVALATSLCGVGVVNPVINHWFRRDLGKATGILSAGFALGGILVPLVFWLIDSFGWRNALVITGIGCLIICIPMALIVRHKPEPYGYGPDGDPLPPLSATFKTTNTRINYTQVEESMGVSQALKSRTFWHLTLSFTLQYLVVSAVIAHIMPYLNTVNINRSTASFFAGAIPIISIFGRLAAGWLSDKYTRKKVALASYVIVFIGTLLFDFVSNNTVWLLFLAVILFSTGYGSVNTLRVVMPRESFGKGRFATIFGFLMGILAFGSMLGPLSAGWIFDVWKSYHYAWLLFTLINVVALILLATTPQVNPRKTATG